MSRTEDASAGFVPNWYCPFSLPANLLGSFHPVIHLVGLDTTSHRDVLETLTLQNVTKNIKPQFKVVPFEHPFHMKKIRNDAVECNMPQGILKSTWVKKHLEEIPCVAIIFFDLNWTNAEWNVKKIECAQKIKALKTQVSGHGTQVLVMLIKSAEADELTSEKASTFCAAADILPKYLYVLPSGHLDKIHMCLQRLEYEAEMFYKARVKRLMVLKEKAAQTPLIVRYNMKIAFFQEIRSDYENALNHYQAANEALLNIKMTEANVQELKVVASILTYRISRLHVLNGNHKEAKTQFEKTIRSFYKLEGNSSLVFEHYAWLETQYHLFGDLLKLNYKLGANFPDPVGYFLTASVYAEKRKALIASRSKESTGWPPEMLPFKCDLTSAFLGQRPWRNDSFSLENTFVVEDPRVLAMLTHLEVLTNHSMRVINHLGVASDFCKVTTRKRTRCQLMCSMAKEFHISGDHKNCIMLLNHILRELSYSKWNSIIFHVAKTGLRAACCEGDVSSYLNFLVILMKTDLAVVNPGYSDLWTKFQAVIEGRMPIIEEGCEINVDNWQRNLHDNFVARVECHENSILSFNFWFVKETVTNLCSATVRFELKNHSDHTITVSKVGIARMNIPEYNNIEERCNVSLAAGEMKEIDLIVKTHARDIGKVLQVQVAYVDIGRSDRSVLLHNSLILPTSLSLWNSEGHQEKLKKKSATVKLEAPKPKLEVKMKRDGFALINEWHRIKVSWTNREEFDCNKLLCSYSILCADNQRVIVTFDPDKKLTLGQNQCTKKLDKLSSSDEIEHIVHLKTANPVDKEIKLIIEGKYFDGNHQAMSVKYEETIIVLQPVQVAQSIVNFNGDPLEFISSGDEFCLKLDIKNVAQCVIVMKEVELELSSTSYSQTATNSKSVIETVLDDGEHSQFIFFMKCSKTEAVSPGHIKLNWQRFRAEQMDLYITNTEIPIFTIPSSFNALYLQAEFSNNCKGKLRMPMLANYKLKNRGLHVQDITVSMDSSESFMNGGPKKIILKLKAQEDADFSYILFPLIPGCVGLPQLVIESLGSEAGEVKQVLNVNTQNVPKHIFVTIVGIDWFVCVPIGPSVDPQITCFTYYDILISVNESLTT